MAKRYLYYLIIAPFLIAQAHAQGGQRNVGVFVLVPTLTITSAISAVVQNTVTNLGGMQAMTVVATLTYTSGGTTVAPKVQTSCDAGTTWLDIAFLGFTTAAGSKYANLSGITSKTATAYAALAADGVNDGLLCDRVRGIVTTTGTYVGTTLTVYAGVR